MFSTSICLLYLLPHRSPPVPIITPLLRPTWSKNWRFPLLLGISSCRAGGACWMTASLWHIGQPSPLFSQSCISYTSMCIIRLIRLRYVYIYIAYIYIYIVYIISVLLYIIIIYIMYNYVYYVYKQLSIHVIWNFVKFRQRMTRHVSATMTSYAGPSEATGTIPQLSCWTPEKPVCQWIGWRKISPETLIQPSLVGFFALPEKWWSF